MVGDDLPVRRLRLAAPAALHAAWPHRGTYLALAVFFTAIAVYGSLVPLRFRALAFSEALARFRAIPFHPPGPGTRADWAANVLLFIPLGYLWLGVRGVDHRAVRKTLLAAPIVVLLLAGLSASLEFLQLWFPDRSVSGNDIVAETLGAAVGVSLWLFAGQALTDWLRSHTADRRPKSRIDRLLEDYFVLLAILSVWPLDLSISVSDLAEKYQRGLISIVPFSGGMESAYAMLGGIAQYIPLGVLAATWLTPAKRPVRPLATSVVLGVLVVAAIEMARLLVLPRFTSTDHVIFGTLGVALGAGIASWLGKGGSHARSPVAARRRPWQLWSCAAVAYAVLLVAVSCWPYRPIHDRQELKARYVGFWNVQVETLAEPYAILDLCAVAMLYAPLGGLLAMVAASEPLPAAIRRIMLAMLLVIAAAFATAIEMLQVPLPPNVPSVGDVMAGTLGVAAGMMLVAWLVPRRNPQA